jgi:hypothetical protein
VTRRRRFGIVRALLLVALLSFCAAQWLGRDACLDRGGVVTAFHCATADGEAQSLLSLAVAPRR